MPPKSPTLYDLKKTTIAFAAAGVVLSVCLFAMIFQDSGREWKNWQRKFMDYSRKQAQQQLEETRKKVDQNKLKELNDQIVKGKQNEASHRQNIRALKKEIEKVGLDLGNAKTQYQYLKQVQESERYFFEEARAKGHKEEEARFRKSLDQREPEFQKSKLLMEELEVKRDGKNADLAKFSEAQTQASREITKLLMAQTVLEKKVKKLTPDLAKAILNAPMLDFIKPSLQVQQIVLENLYDDFYFSKAQKVDRCITCHLGIDQKGLEGAPGPFKSHPRLDLFLSSNSAHPMEKFGCTTCHGGSGQSVTFTTAAHTPKNEEQAKDWKKKYHWEEMHHWTDKMLPTNHVEAACAKCHQGTVEVPQAPKLNEGRQLAETFGCYGCHKVQGVEVWKAGPSLVHVQSKLEQDWIVRWLQNPKEFRPSTKMPRIFHLSNTSDPESTEKNNAAIAGIAAYLMKNSDPISLTAPAAKGDAAEGEKQIKTLGCTGCHTVAGQAANSHGPELSGLGSKVKPEWLFTWLKNPKAYHPETRMPSLRLSDEEAANITAYLLSLRNEKFESMQLPLVKPEAVDNLALSYLVGTMRQEEAKAELAKMNDDQKMEFVGKKVIAHQGCFGCHDIKGFEASKPIGTELTEEAAKDIHKFYSGFVHLEETKQAWFKQKLKEPRIFDKGRELPYLEKLRMPNFDFTDEQAESLVTFLLSMQKASIPLEMRKKLDSVDVQVEEGRALVHKFNCNGCHTLDGKEGKARELFEDKGNAPPIIFGEGKKVQSNWLYHFLQNPTTIRPWLKYRMPTFGFSDKELNTMVQYFNGMDHVSQVYLENQKPNVSEEDLKIGHELFEKFQCIKCHKAEAPAGLSASFLAPNLVMSKNRLRPDWVVEWLKDPQALMEGTMMPGFFADGQTPFPDHLGGDAVKQMQAIRDYIW